MITFVDSVNYVKFNENGPDRLRGEVSRYPGTQRSDLQGSKIFFEISNPEVNNDKLIKTIKHTISLEAKTNVFRDERQWTSYVNSLVSEGQNFLDHTFTFNPPTVTNKFIKNFHHPLYEDATKEFDSNQLLNYNLLTYTGNRDVVERIAHLKTAFDTSLNDLSVSTLMDQYRNRISSYSGSIEETVSKQRNLYILPDIDDPLSSRAKEDFPYYYEKTFNFTRQSNSFFDSLQGRQKTKNLFQSLKRDLSFSNRSFNIGGTDVSAKIYDVIALLTSTSIVNIVEGNDEMFLVPEREVNNFNRIDRFVNQINTVRFLSDMRDAVIDKTRNLSQIFENQSCEKFLLGYKIEKYLTNDASGPIQTYYTTDNSFVDTQLKYGFRYIYKTKALVGVFGSSYSYSNLDIDGVNFKATLEAEVFPSFQILEYELETDNVAFIDTPMLTPHVTTYVRKDLAQVNFLFQPRLFTHTDSNGLEALPPIGNLRPGDEDIASLYELAGDQSSSPDYFTGIYEVYRLENPPISKKEFQNGFLTIVDDSINAGNLDRTSIPIENVDVDYAFFSDRIIPNKKYYYAFRTITYHGTPSQLTLPLEIELLKDSDEYKISVKEYHYPIYKNYKYQKNSKRILRIVPNMERLLFTSIDPEDLQNFILGDSELVPEQNSTKTFKIRVTSKHTGKKLDINVSFKINKDGTLVPQ